MLKNKEILEKINKNNILDILNIEISDYTFIYETDIDYIISNIIALRYEMKNEDTEMANKIKSFLVNNIDEFKNLNVDIICESPYFEKEIEKRKQKEENDLIQYADAQEKCPKCNDDKVKHLGDKQLRGADEGMTSFFICINDNCPYYIENRENEHKMENEKRYQFRK